MIGRGCYGRPWFVRQVIDWLKTRRRVPDPPLAAQLEIVLGHYEEMLLHYGTAVGSRIARKHVAWYSKGLPGSAEFRAAVNETDRRRARSEPDPRLLRAAAGPRDGMIKTPLRRRGSSNPKRRPLGVARPDAAVILAALARSRSSSSIAADGIRFVNPAAEQFFGSSAAALLRQRARRFRGAAQPAASRSSTRCWRIGNTISEYDMLLEGPRFGRARSRSRGRRPARARTCSC